MKILLVVTCCVGMFFFFSTRSVRGSLHGQDQYIPIEHYLSPSDVQKLTATLEKEPTEFHERIHLLLRIIFGT